MKYTKKSRTLFDNPPDDVDFVRLPEDQPGGFEWGNNQRDENNENNPQ